MRYTLVPLLLLMLSGCFKPVIKNKLGEHCFYNNNRVMITKVAVEYNSSSVVNQVTTQDDRLILVNQDLLVDCE